MTTPYGIMDHEEAKKIQTGGKILGFFYWHDMIIITHTYIVSLYSYYINWS
jgi:hypothetical protein